MANKRTLKRCISTICGELLAECMAASLYGHNSQAAEALIYGILAMENDFIRRISHPEPGMKAKKYYKTLREDFAAHACEIVDQIRDM
ncbi:MAG: hypothetical protein J1E37_07100 [Prevotella sp.]|nr:hypothetical protein [Prevotella sp.]